jgi:hypothetical protein
MPGRRRSGENFAAGRYVPVLYWKPLIGCDLKNEIIKLASKDKFANNENLELPVLMVVKNRNFSF